MVQRIEGCTSCDKGIKGRINPHGTKGRTPHIMRQGVQGEDYLHGSKGRTLHIT